MARSEESGASIRARAGHRHLAKCPPNDSSAAAGQPTVDWRALVTHSGVSITGSQRLDSNGHLVVKMPVNWPTCVSRDRESGTNRGRLRGLVLPVGVGEAGVPAPVVVAGGVVE